MLLALCLVGDASHHLLYEKEPFHHIMFIRLLKRLKATYCRTKTITLLEDNYIIHKGRETQRWLKDKPKCRVIYQPV
ncbi:hypothetical protein ECO9602_04148 [Escherichia coli O111:H8 str. CVM9602]|nr:hypothetical protein ECO9602_04148 [Escherichia coli O111:H8 str. CVM9602]